MKKVFLLGVIAYSACILLLQDWPLQTAATGSANFIFLGKMLIDVFFGGYAALKLFGSDFIPQDETDDEVTTIKLEEISVPDNWFYGLFSVNLLGNIGYHGYLTSIYSDERSVYFTIWFIVEAVALGLTFIFFKHAQRVALKNSRRPNLRNVA